MWQETHEEANHYMVYDHFVFTHLFLHLVNFAGIEHVKSALLKQDHLQNVAQVYRDLQPT